MKLIPVVSYGPPLTSDTKQVPTSPYMCSYDVITKHALENSEYTQSIGEIWIFAKKS